MDPLTINGPIPFGRHRDGTVAAAAMRQKCVAVVGTPGSGKTVVEQCFVAGLARCPDALIWMVDMSNGGLANPWLNPWLDQDMATPVVDWVALSQAEALTMCDAANQIIDSRRLAYRQWMRRNNTDKLPVCFEVPAIYLLLDEGKEATGAAGNQRLVRALIKIADKGRGMAVRIIITGLRGTAEVIPSEMMADIGARLVMNVASDAELNHVLGWKQKYNARDFPYPGCGLWRPGLDGSAPQRFRSFDLSEPSSIESIAYACEPWRPALDEPSLAGLSAQVRDAYVSRWERAVPVLTGAVPDEPASAHLGTPPQMSQGPVSLPELPGSVLGVDLPAMIRRIQGAPQRVRRAQAAERMVGERLDHAWADLAGRLDDDRAGGGEGWNDDAATEPRARMRQLLAAAGPDGMSGPKIRDVLSGEGHDVPMTTLYRWLAADADDGGYGVWCPRKGKQP